MNDLIREIQSKINSKIHTDYDMKKSSWFRAGGRAKGFVTIDNINDLKIILSFRDHLKYYVIGVGSNLLVRDSGFNGILIKLGRNFNNIKFKKNILSVGAGVLDINLSRFAVRNSIKDFEFFAGIPGTIGGAVKMNAGCYGSQTADNLVRVLILNKFGKIKYIDFKDLNLRYRYSSVDDKTIILKAEFSYEFASKEQINHKRDQIKLKRQSSQPIKEKTSGSTFKNPPGEFAAELIDKAGCKGMKIGGASISKLHSNFIINNGNAKAKDIETLGKKVVKRVKEKFGIHLEWEVKILGN